MGDANFEGFDELNEFLDNIASGKYKEQNDDPDYAAVANHIYKTYSAFLEAGFDDDHAFELTKLLVFGAIRS